MSDFAPGDEPFDGGDGASGQSRWIPRHVLKMDVLLQAGLLALEHWDGLTAEEQQRFRLLAQASQGDAKINLTKEEYRELRDLWKKLEVRHLIAKGVRMAFRRTPSKRSLR